MAGFGRAPFGSGPFGRSATGKDLIVEPFPDEYLDNTILLDPGESLKNNNKDPLLMVLNTYANSVFQRRIQIDTLPSILDPEAAPLEIVRLFGEMLGLSIDKNDPEFLQRTLLNSASQWLQIKASKQGYSIRGLASGFDVTVTNFWRLDEIYEPLIPDRFKFFLVPPEADPGAIPILHTDQPPGTFIGTPTVEDKTYAKSAYVQVIFEVHEPRLLFVDYNVLLDLVILKIRDVVGIHHELLAPVFLTKMFINVNESVNIFQIDEVAIFQANECYIFDITPADVVPTDQCFPTVNITTADTRVLTVNTSFSVTIEIPEVDDIFLEINVPLSTSVQILEAITPMHFEEFYHFDIVPADVMPTDNSAGLVIIDILEYAPMSVGLSMTDSITLISELADIVIPLQMSIYLSPYISINYLIGVGEEFDELISPMNASLSLGSDSQAEENSTNISTNLDGTVDITIIVGP